MNETNDEIKYILTGGLIRYLEVLSCMEFPPETRMNLLSDELAKEHERTMDMFGILHGEDAKKFIYEMNNPNPPTDRDIVFVKRAFDILEKEEKEKDARIRKEITTEIINNLAKWTCENNWVSDEFYDYETLLVSANALLLELTRIGEGKK
jgi:hypothetical protein